VESHRALRAWLLCRLDETGGRTFLIMARVITSGAFVLCFLSFQTWSRFRTAVFSEYSWQIMDALPVRRLRPGLLVTLLCFRLGRFLSRSLRPSVGQTVALPGNGDKVSLPSLRSLIAVYLLSIP